jgi:hypothetical protein
MLLNEFLKEYRKVQELEMNGGSSRSTLSESALAKRRRLSRSGKQIEALTGTVQKVSDHHQYRKPDADGRENDVERQRQRHLRPGKEKIAHRFGRRACWRQNSANAR